MENEQTPNPKIAQVIEEANKEFRITPEGFYRRPPFYAFEISEFLRQAFQAGELSFKERVLEKIEERQRLFNFIPQDEHNRKYVKSSDLQIVDLISALHLSEVNEK